MAIADAARELEGVEVLDRSGEKVGRITHLYADRETGEMTFASVRTGLFGMRSSFVPIQAAERDGQNLRVPFTKDQIKDAPNVDADDELSQVEEERLHSHYGLAYGGAYEGLDHPSFGDAGHDTSGPETDEAMTRSEEQVRVGTRSDTVGHARLRKYVTTEHVSETVPVRHEEARIEREPITDANRGQALDGPDITEEEHEVALHAESPVVGKETVPQERVRLTTETVTDEAPVEADRRVEHIEPEGDLRDGR